MSPKRIKELTQKKHREETGLFLVEGDKNIREALNSELSVVYLTGTKDFLGAIKELIARYEERTGKALSVKETSEEELIKTGTLLSNNAGIAVVEMKAAPSLDEVIAQASASTVVILDDVRDPGNLGTIMRTSDWYGITHIAASRTTTDATNSKVIAASMGSFTRIKVAYIDLETLLKRAEERSLPVIAADLEGESTHTASLPRNGFLLMGSESHGVSQTARAYATHRVMIPRFGSAESLNVSVATGILLDSIKRI